MLIQNKLYFASFILLSALFFTNCKNESGHKPNIEIEKVKDSKKSTSTNSNPKTAEMISKVKTAVSKINPDNITYYLNESRAQLLESKMANLDGIEKSNMQIQYASELLNAGYTDQSITSFESVIKDLERADIQNKEAILYKIKKQLAIAYMRKGEQENCLQNHTSASCIIPIAKEGQHQLREGSEKTIQLLNELLKEKPNDKECQYLLNIAHMTLGQYPNKVDKPFAINARYFETSPFPKFTDIGTELGVGVSELSGGTCIDDFNNDGYLDIIASSWGFDDQIQYFENNKNGGFVNKTKEAGLSGVTGGLNLRHADYDNDGNLDFIILRGAWFFQEGKIPNSLMRNNGDGTFTDETISAGLYS
ncbi:MAG: FG-GAP-like repeat-containing protein, partial [Bacteroidota bacterium]